MQIQCEQAVIVLSVAISPWFCSGPQLGKASEGNTPSLFHHAPPSPSPFWVLPLHSLLTTSLGGRGKGDVMPPQCLSPQKILSMGLVLFASWQGNLVNPLD